MSFEYPSAKNTFIPDHDATNKMVIDFARNIKSFAVGRYCQVVPVKKVMGLYLEMTVEEAGRILYTDLRNFDWPDGVEAPEGNDGTESFEFKPYTCMRRSFPVMLGNLTIDQASWNILAQHTSIKSRQAMTARTQLVVTALTTSASYASTHRVNVVTGVTGNTGNWSQSTTARQDIKRSLNFAANRIMLDTLSAIELDDLVLVINPNLAAELAQTQEIVDYIKHSEQALAQIKGELPGENSLFGLPNKLYGFPLVVEKTAKVTTKKGSNTQSRSYVYPDATPVLCARPGGIVGVADAPNFSTCVLFALEELAVEVRNDQDNRRTQARVVENVTAKLVAPVSGVLFSAVM